METPLELYEQYRIHFAESYLAACAELSGPRLRL